MRDFVPHWEYKAWGRVQHVFHSAESAVSVLEVRPGTQCSIHYHEDRLNQFAVIRGVICVEEWNNGLSSEPDYFFLGAGDVHEVHTKIYHRFRVIEPGDVVEVYSSEFGNAVRLDDIVRHVVGGPDKQAHELKEQYKQWQISQSSVE